MSVSPSTVAALPSLPCVSSPHTLLTSLSVRLLLLPLLYCRSLSPTMASPSPRPAATPSPSSRASSPGAPSSPMPRRPRRTSLRSRPVPITTDATSSFLPCIPAPTLGMRVDVWWDDRSASFRGMLAHRAKRLRAPWAFIVRYDDGDCFEHDLDAIPWRPALQHPSEAQWVQPGSLEDRHDHSGVAQLSIRKMAGRKRSRLNRSTSKKCSAKRTASLDTVVNTPLFEAHQAWHASAVDIAEHSFVASSVATSVFSPRVCERNQADLTHSSNPPELALYLKDVQKDDQHVSEVQQSSVEPTIVPPKKRISFRFGDVSTL